jgi:hypothetical protein
MAVEAIAATEAGTATAAGSSMFGSLLGWVGLGYTAFSLFNSWGAYREQKKQQRALAEQQIKQSNLLREKIKADNAGLYSAVQSSTAQTAGAMGAVY